MAANAAFDQAIAGQAVQSATLAVSESRGKQQSQIVRCLCFKTTRFKAARISSGTPTPTKPAMVTVSLLLIKLAAAEGLMTLELMAHIPMPVSG